MDGLFINWKTSLAGLVTIALGALHSYFGVDIPGINLDLGSAIPVGLGLILAADGLAVPGFYNTASTTVTAIPIQPLTIKG
jgi:hypothetical protein